MSTGSLLIAEFARRARLPVSTLRYYDRIGLLRPAEVDPHSGYRRYRSDQLADAVTIARLRAIGTRPDTIARVLAGGSARAAALASERDRLAGEIRDRTRALAGLDDLDSFLATAPRPVTLLAAEAPALPFATSAEHLPVAIRRSVATLRARLRRHRLSAVRWGALLPLDLTDQVRGHVFADLDDVRPPPEPSLHVLSLPTGTGLRATHDGPYDVLAHTYHRLFAAIDERDAVPTGPVIEHYSVDAPARTEITVLAAEGR